MSERLVIDSSVVVKWLNREGEEHLAQANKLLLDLSSGSKTADCPELVKYEVGNALLLGKKLLPEQFLQAADALFALPIGFIPFSYELVTEAYQLARRFKLTFYDAAFLALAKKEKASLITANPKHQQVLLKETPVISLDNYV